jgi:hypothetical protein
MTQTKFLLALPLVLAAGATAAADPPEARKNRRGFPARAAHFRCQIAGDYVKLDPASPPLPGNRSSTPSDT